MLVPVLTYATAAVTTVSILFIYLLILNQSLLHCFITQESVKKRKGFIIIKEETRSVVFNLF